MVKQLVGDINTSSRKADMKVMMIDLKKRQKEDNQIKTQSSIDSNKIQIRLKEEITSMYKQQLKIFEAHFSLHFNSLHNNQEVDPHKNNLMSILVKDIDEKFKGRLKKVTGKIYEKSPSLFFSYWEERYAILDCRKFKYFKRKGDKLPLAILNFDLFEAEA